MVDPRSMLDVLDGLWQQKTCEKDLRSADKRDYLRGGALGELMERHPRAAKASPEGPGDSEGSCRATYRHV